jgi:anti-sigma factor RsiW
MNSEVELELQAYLDGELAGADVRRVETLLANDAGAKALFQELKTTKSLLAGNESEIKVPESREFYWSKIERAIERAEKLEPAAATNAGAWLGRWRRYLAPLAGVAAVIALGVGTAKMYDAATMNGSAKHLAEIVNLSDETGSYSFRSQSENMFVVWVYDRDQEKTDISDQGEDEVMPQ